MTNEIGRAYVAGKMRGIPNFNFEAFAEATDWLRDKGWKVISPAEIDLELGIDPTQPLPEWFTIETAMQRDLHEITHPLMTAIVMLPGWVQSEGSLHEVRTAMACGLDVYFYCPNGFDGNKDKRLLAISYEIVEMTIKENEVQSNRVTSATGGQKNQNAIRYDLVPSAALEEVARVYGHGATKYEANNWMRGYDYSLSAAALQRHWHAWMMGEQDDAEGFKHLAAVVFHAFTLLYRDRFQPEWDDIHQ